MRAVAPRHAPHIDQLDINLVDEGRRLQELAGALLGHLAVRPAMQFAIDERRQLLEGLLVALAPGSQQLRHIVRRRLACGLNILIHPIS
jgi:hypothetical protein